MATSTITGTILQYDGTAYASAAVKSYRSQPPDLQSVAATADAEATTNASGVFSLTLYRNTSFPVEYKIVFPNGASGKITVGRGDSALNVGTVAISDSPYRLDMTQTLRDNIQRYNSPVMTQNSTVATTGNTDYVFVAPHSGTLVGADANTATTLATNDTNYVTFSVTNITNSNAAMLAATDANTTKATGGAAWTASTVRALTLNGTAANLVVNQGDVIRVRFAATGTLGGALSNPSVNLRIV